MYRPEQFAALLARHLTAGQLHDIATELHELEGDDAPSGAVGEFLGELGDELHMEANRKEPPDNYDESGHIIPPASYDEKEKASNV